MRSILFLFLLSAAMFTRAQSKENQPKIKSIVIPIKKSIIKEHEPPKGHLLLVRYYRTKNSRVKKALSFKTGRRKPKLA